MTSLLSGPLKKLQGLKLSRSSRGNANSDEYDFTAEEEAEVKRFRLLIIGKTGCGKTTILSKVCGEDQADKPSTSRGCHDIEKEITFQTNRKLVVHDSEGFEAGRPDELDVVKSFIERKTKTQDIHERLHMIWYCVEMNSRPIQHAEQQFFSTRWRVPVIAIVTKFDNFLEDILQDLEESADDGILEAQLNTMAQEKARSILQEHFIQPLMALPNPPKAIVHLSETHRSTPANGRLKELIKATMEALSTGDPLRDKFQILFSSAQMADTSWKVKWSFRCGMQGSHCNLLSFKQPIEMEYIYKQWELSGLNKEIFKKLAEKYLANAHDIHRIGHPQSPSYMQVWNWPTMDLQLAKRAQLISDISLILEKVFLYSITSEADMNKLFCWYIQKSNDCPWVKDTIRKAYSPRPRLYEVRDDDIFMGESKVTDIYLMGGCGGNEMWYSTIGDRRKLEVLPVDFAISDYITP